MWLGATEPAASDAQTAIILAVIGLLSLVLVAVVTGIFSLLTAKANRTSPAPPQSGTPPQDLAFRDHVIGELAVGRQRDDDNDDRDDVQDHELRNQRDVLDEHHDRLSSVERYLDAHDTDWRPND